MKYIRIGNDIHIEWIILRNMQPESFADKEVTVKLYDKNGLPQNFEFTKNGSSIVGTFYGKDQSTTGNYRLELVENAGEPNMVTLDYIDCFILSAKLKNTTASGNDSSYGIKTDVVNLASNINLGGSTTSAPGDVDLSSYAKISYVDAKLALKANLSDIPQPIDTSNFALKSEIPNMTEYAKKSEIPSMENVATKDELFSGDYNDLTNKPTIPDTSNFALKTDIPNMSEYAKKSEIPNMDNVATKDEIPVIPEFKTINGASIIGTGNITIEGGGQAYDDTEVKNRLTALENKEDADTIYDDTEIRNLIAGKQDAGDYALKSELPDMSNVATKDEIPVIPEFKTINGNSIVGTGNITIEGGGQAYDDTEIRGLIRGKQDKLTEEQLANIDMDHSTFALKSELPNMSNVATKDELFSGDYNDLSNKPTIPDTSNFALKSELPDMSNVATKDELPNLDDYALKSEIPTSTGLNEAEVNALIDAKLGGIETKLSEI